MKRFTKCGLWTNIEFMINWTKLDPNSNCRNQSRVTIWISGSCLNQHSTWPHLPFIWTRFSSATTWAYRWRNTICLITMIMIIPHPQHLLSLSQLCNKSGMNYELFREKESEREERERGLDLCGNWFYTKLDRKFTDPIHQKAARTCYRNLWPQHSTSPQLQEREKNKILRFKEREREREKTKNWTLFFLSEESITLVGKTNPTQQKFNLQNLKAKIFTAKCGWKYWWVYNKFSA